ncbi:molybdopterin molybdotransferase MoeA [Streptomyces swartbergensis]|uniref:Molybdopterin molybdenumtransferase n=1 Tax=Streptomyces swartbergensis TaxID=487165 RepID=A0A243RZK8_9ACTN|nr:molybdopterin molybdotransferase MoeA [Streptomyces swartbergensis]OUD00619.1 molybdopterin molybdenumtransferase MoeA [Streptomyces swartbergensis]
MTPHGTRAGEDAEDLDVEEVLALVNNNNDLPGPAERGETDSRRASGRPDTSPRPDARHHATPWPEARATAARAARSTTRAARRRPVTVPLEAALGLTLAAPLDALTDLPSFDTSAMDGWAVAGPAPWDVRDDGVLAGHGAHEPLTDGEAVRIATGARIPPDTTAVLRSEHGRTDEKGRLYATRDVVPGQDIRPRGQECRSGDQLLPVGALVTPAVLGLAAAAGYDTVTAVPRPRAEVLVLGDELLTEGRPHDGLIRDALGPMLPPWLRALGVEVTAVRRVGDDAEALHQAITTSDADVVVTTGGTAAGPVDHVHPILRRIGAELLVDGVKVRPGHPMLLARITENRHLVGLPGNPLAAVSGLLTLAEPLLRTLAARPAPEPYTLPLRDAVHGHPYDTRLVPVVLRGDQAVPLRYNGPAMLRGVAAADALAVVPPGGARPGQEAELLDLPWASGGIGVCFT